MTISKYSIVFFLFLFVTSLPIYSQIYFDYIGAGHTDEMLITSSDSDSTTMPIRTFDGMGIMPDNYGASRFLSQATLGADYETIQKVATKGYTDWLEEQFEIPASTTQNYLDTLVKVYIDSLIASTGDSSISTVTNIPSNFWQFSWWQTTMTSDDLLRHRVALALSEIFVVSDVGVLDLFPEGLASYYDMLLENSFGCFDSLLLDVTLHPCMGTYLTHLNNPKTDSTINRFPDENYAREIMQLFTIGLYELNPDGTRKTDANGDWIPTYDNSHITEFARVFTGLSFGGTNTNFGTRRGSYRDPMQMFEDRHEEGTKNLLNGEVVPTGQTGMEDIQAAINNLFNHNNTGTFIGRQLIQRLVTSNPSKAYISRITEAFNDNGNGQRGDMKHIIKSVLLDPEARDCGLRRDTTNGMLREPMLKQIHLMRAFNAVSLDSTYHHRNDLFWKDTGQRPLSSPSVFNFFLPEYQPIGKIGENDLVAPVFQLLNSNTSLGFLNQENDWFFGTNKLMDTQPVFGTTVADNAIPQLDLSDEITLATAGDLDGLIDRLDLILTSGDLSPTTRLVIKTTLTSLTDPQEIVAMALYLIMLSPDYAILR